MFNEILNQPRKRTVMGPQGAHVSAYALFQEIVVAGIAGLPMEDAVRVVAFILDSYGSNRDVQKAIDAAQNRIGDIHSKINKLEFLFMGEHSLKEPERSHLIDVIVDGYDAQLKSIVGDLITTHLALRNHLDFVTFPEEFNFPLTKEEKDREGSKIQSALNFLRNLNSFEDVNLISQNISDLIFYPEILMNQLYDSNDPRKKESWEKASKKYNKGTRLRDNDLDNLCFVLERHISLVFSAFSIIRNTDPDNKKIIMKDFLNFFLSNYWKNLNDEEKRKICDIVSHNVYKMMPNFFEDELSASSDGSENRSKTDSGDKMQISESGSSASYQTSSGERMLKSFLDSPGSVRINLMENYLSDDDPSYRESPSTKESDEDAEVVDIGIAERGLRPKNTDGLIKKEGFSIVDSESSSDLRKKFIG